MRGSGSQGQRCGGHIKSSSPALPFSSSPEVIILLTRMLWLCCVRIAQRSFGGAGFPRTAYAEDRTGHALLHTMYEQSIRNGIKFYGEWLVTRLVVNNGRCSGVVGYNIEDGQIGGFLANAVIFATGGYGICAIPPYHALWHEYPYN